VSQDSLVYNWNESDAASWRERPVQILDETLRAMACKALRPKIPSWSTSSKACGGWLGWVSRP
jgi:hypothetical protein